MSKGRKNGYLYVGRDNGEAIYEKDGKYYREKDRADLVEMSEREFKEFETKRAKFEVKGDIKDKDSKVRFTLDN